MMPSYIGDGDAARGVSAHAAVAVLVLVVDVRPGRVLWLGRWLAWKRKLYGMSAGIVK
jgi:hypothetical protein